MSETTTIKRLWFTIDDVPQFLTIDELREELKYGDDTEEDLQKIWNAASKDQPKRKNANPGCDQCGLEAVDDSLEFGVHIPSGDYCPCRYCIRNPHALKPIGDFWEEEWCVDVDNEAIIEDPTAEQEKMLANLAALEIKRINEEGWEEAFPGNAFAYEPTKELKEDRKKPEFAEFELKAFRFPDTTFLVGKGSVQLPSYVIMKRKLNGGEKNAR